MTQCGPFQPDPICAQNFLHERAYPHGTEVCTQHASDRKITEISVCSHLPFSSGILQAGETLHTLLSIHSSASHYFSTALNSLFTFAHSVLGEKQLPAQFSI